MWKSCRDDFSQSWEWGPGGMRVREETQPHSAEDLGSELGTRREAGAPYMRWVLCGAVSQTHAEAH